MKLTFFTGITFYKWIKFLNNKEIKLSSRYFFNYVWITILSIINQIILVPEKTFFNVKNKQKPKDPIFILGLWRSGTTLLHFLLNKDEKFCAPNNFQCIFPHTFNVMEKLLPINAAKVSAPRPQDNMEVKIDSPCEDEVALCSLVPDFALYNYFSFSKDKEYFLRFLDFNECEDNIVNQWLNAHKSFHYKISNYFKNKRIIYKSPAHTARIRQLIKIYPNASFIFISRHPLNFFQSSINGIEKLSEIIMPLQKIELKNLQEMIFTNCKQIINRMNEDLDLIPKENFCSLKYEDLVSYPIDALYKIHDEIGLGAFNKSQDDLKNYLRSIKDYKTNKYRPYTADIKDRILKEFQSYIKKWEY